MDEYHPITRAVWWDGRGWPESQVRTKRTKASRSRRRRRKLWLFNPHCHYCHKKLLFDESTIDHLKPLSKGGTDTVTNRVLACQPCNQAKADQFPFAN